MAELSRLDLTAPFRTPSPAHKAGFGVVLTALGEPDAPLTTQ